MTIRGSLKKYGCQLLASMGLTPTEAKRLMDYRQGRQPTDAGKITIRNTADGIGEILIYEAIGLDWWTDEGLTAKRFDEQVKALGSITELVVRINSNGGDVFDGLAIYNILDRIDVPVTVIIDGIAASAASYIAMAGDVVQMPPSAIMMIHDASGMVVGNAADMRELADVLEKIDGQIAGIYAAKTGRPSSEFRDAMDNNTYYTAAEAVAIGLADVMLDETKSSPKDKAMDHTSSMGKSSQVVDPQAISVRLRKIEIDETEMSV